MEKQEFLSGFSDNNIRDYLWPVFEDAETEAKRFGVDSSSWIPVDKVLAGNRWVWAHSSGQYYIEVCRRALENNKKFGGVFHEVFHSAFEGSPLWCSDKSQNAGGHGQWGDAFGDAFRYYMEEKLLPGYRLVKHNDYKELYPKTSLRIISGTR